MNVEASAQKYFKNGINFCDKDLYEPRQDIASLEKRPESPMFFGQLPE